MTAHVVVRWGVTLCAEYDYRRIYDSMLKPAFLFDGRLILDHAALKDIGFEVHMHACVRVRAAV